jgi:putative hydrolase of the HAD superfamily
MGPVSKFRWIAFDAVGTVIYPTPPVGEVYYEAARRFGSQLDRDEISRRFKEAFRDSERSDAADDLTARLATSESRERARWQEIVAAVIDDISDGATCFAELFAHFSRAQAWSCYEEVPALLDWLREQGYRVAIASNFDSRLHSVCDGIDALRHVDMRVISSEIGWRKPSRAFFEALVAGTGCHPDEILMVGDDFENDIAGARRLGMAAVLLNRKGASGLGDIEDLSQLRELLSRSRE